MWGLGEILSGQQASEGGSVKENFLPELSDNFDWIPIIIKYAAPLLLFPIEEMSLFPVVAWLADIFQQVMVKGNVRVGNIIRRKHDCVVYHVSQPFMTPLAQSAIN